MVHNIYLDHHTAAKPHAASVDALLFFLKEQWGSTTAPHQKGQELFPHLQQSTTEILKLCGAGPEDAFCFFSSHAEATQFLYQRHYFDSVRQTGKNHLIVSNVEESPVVNATKRLEELGCTRKILPVNAQGQITKQMLEDAIGPRTSLVSLSWANALTGVLHPIADLAEVCREKGVKLHVDASYVLGKMYFCFEDLPIDFLTFDGSLVHAPKGTAGLLLKAEHASLAPSAMMEGVHVGGIAAIAAALSKNEQLVDHVCLETARLRDRFEKGIKAGLSDARVLFHEVERLPNCSCIAFPGIISDALLYLLHRKGVYATFGGGRFPRLQHVLGASGIDEMLAQSALSFSLSCDTTEEEIEAAIQAVISCVHQLKACGQMIGEGAR